MRGDEAYPPTATFQPQGLQEAQTQYLSQQQAAGTQYGRPQPVPVPPPEQQYYQPQPQPPQRQRGNGVIIALLSTIVVLLAAIGGWLLYDSSVFHRSSTPSTRPTVVETVVVPPSDAGTAAEPSTKSRASSQTSEGADSGQRASLADLPGNATPVGNGGDTKFTSQATGSEHTSSPFAEAVGEAFRDEYYKTKKPPTSLHVYSPVTKKTYSMKCTVSNNIATCIGGNRAIVYVW